MTPAYVFTFARTDKPDVTDQIKIDPAILDPSTDYSLDWIIIAAYGEFGDRRGLFAWSWEMYDDPAKPNIADSEAWFNRAGWELITFEKVVEREV